MHEQKARSGITTFTRIEKYPAQISDMLLSPSNSVFQNRCTKLKLIKMDTFYVHRIQLFKKLRKSARVGENFAIHVNPALEIFTGKLSISHAKN